MSLASAAPLRPLLAELGRLAADPVTAATGLALERMRPQLPVMSSDERLLYAAAWDRLSSWTAANGMLAQVAATTLDDSQRSTDRRVDELEADSLVTELTLLLRRSHNTVSSALNKAQWLTGNAPALFALLQRGDATTGHSWAFHDETMLLDPEQARAVDEQVSARAATTTVAAFRRILRRAVAEIAPDAGERHKRAKQTAGVQTWPDRDGMAIVQARLAAMDAVALMDELNARADAIAINGDERTHGMRQVDALLDAVLGDHSCTSTEPDPAANHPAAADPTDTDPTDTDPTDTDPTDCDAADEGADEVAGGAVDRRRRSRRRPVINAYVDLLSLLGLRDSPGWLDGYGPVPADLLRELAREGSVLRRLIHDPITGVLIDYGRSRYLPDAHLRGLLEARDVTCRFPGCQRRAAFCQTEHCEPYDDDGATSCANCGLMCQKHHNHKTHAGFSYTRPDPATGETIWTTPHGFVFRQTPAGYGPAGVDTGDTVRLVPVPDDPDPPPG